LRQHQPRRWKSFPFRRDRTTCGLRPGVLGTTAHGFGLTGTGVIQCGQVTSGSRGIFTTVEEPNRSAAATGANHPPGDRHSYVFRVFDGSLPLPARDERGGSGTGEAAPHFWRYSLLSPALSSRRGGEGEDTTVQR